MKGHILVFIGILMLIMGCDRSESSLSEQTPFPYKIEKVEQDLSEIDAQALVLGDEMAKDFMRFAPILSQRWKDKKNITFNFTHLGSEKDGLHRSLHYFTHAKNLPKFIFYFVGNSELFEKKFHVKNGPQIIKNIEKFKEGKWTTAAYFLPFLKKYIYPNVKTVNLSLELNQDPTEYSNSELLTLFSTNFVLYEQELESLVREAKKRDKILIFVTNPINLNWPPEVICGDESEESKQLIAKAATYFQSGEVKRAHSLLDELYKEAPANAQLYYLLGKSYYQMGSYLQAKENFISSNALDCNTNRGNVVYNAIAKKIAKQYSLAVIDFFHLVNNNLGQKGIFKDERFPEDYFYNKLLDEIWNEIAPLIKF